MLIPAAVLSVTLAGVFSETFRDWLLSDESGSTTIRNLGLVLAGLIALPLAIWRSLVAQRQADAAQQSLRNERYQKGAEMLGSEVLSVRLGGIYALQRLDDEYPEEYHLQIMNLLCAFIRHPTQDEKHEKRLEAMKTDVRSLRDDVAAAMTVICKRDSLRIELEQEHDFVLDLSDAYLAYAVLTYGRLQGVMFWQANLYYAMLVNADLSGADLGMANLDKAMLHDADLSGTDLSHVGYLDIPMPAKGLTQDQLDQARASNGNPPKRLLNNRANRDKAPKIQGVFDAIVGQPLVWTGGRGEPLKDDE